jgi:hypothetical protein
MDEEHNATELRKQINLGFFPGGEIGSVAVAFVARVSSGIQ